MFKELAPCVLALSLLNSGLWAAETTWNEGCEKVGLSMGGSIFHGNCSPHDPNLLAVATDMGGSFVTYDSGKKWYTIHYSQMSGSHGVTPVFHPTDPNTFYWGYCGCELKVTHDKGQTWTHVGGRQPWRGGISRIWLDPDRPERIVIGSSTETFFSRDEGKSWNLCTNVAGALYRVVADRKSPADARVYCLGTDKGIYRSDDDGRTFAKKIQGLGSEKFGGFAGGSNDKGTILYVSTPCKLQDGKLVGGVFRSRDRGETWERCMTTGINVQTNRTDEYANGDLPDYQLIACADVKPERAYVFCDGTSYWPPNHATVYRTDNAGDSWKSVLATDPRFRKSDPQLKDPESECNVELDWQTEIWGQREQGSLRGMEVSPGNPDVVVLNEERFLFVTTDAGKTWKSPCNGARHIDAQGRKSWATSGEVCTSSWNYYIDPFDKQIHYICYTDICLGRSVDGGKTWMPESYRLREELPEAWLNSCYAMAFDPDVSGRAWAAFSGMHDIPNDNALFHGGGMKRRGGIAITQDHGETWKKVAMPVNGPAMSIAVDPKSPKESRTLYVSMFDRGVFRSDDGGATWAGKTNGLGSSTMRCLNLILHQDGTLFVATTCKGRVSPEGVGIWRSTDKGETWTNIAAGQNWSWIRDFTVKPDDSQTVLVPTTRLDAGLHRTTDGGKTWETIYRNKDQHYFFGATYHPARKGWIYLTCGESEDGSDSYGLYLSKDDGKTWTPYTKVPFRSIERIAFNPDDPEHILLTTFGSSILKVPVEP